MKKSSFVAMIMGTVGGIFFGLGMCMSMLPQWNLFRPGVVMGCVGLLVWLVTVLVWRRMEQKAPIQLNGRTVGTVLFGIAGALLLGVGMCLAMIWGRMAVGIAVGIAGILALVSLVPMTRGIQ